MLIQSSTLPQLLACRLQVPVPPSLPSHLSPLSPALGIFRLCRQVMPMVVFSRMPEKPKYGPGEFKKVLGMASLYRRRNFIYMERLQPKLWPSCLPPQLPPIHKRSKLTQLAGRLSTRAEYVSRPCLIARLMLADTHSARIASLIGAVCVRAHHESFCAAIARLLICTLYLLEHLLGDRAKHRARFNDEICARGFKLVVDCTCINY
jgi:hypothetical protein